MKSNFVFFYELTTFLLLPLTLRANPADFTCSSDMDCSLGGTCNPSTHTCDCDPTWTGLDCGMLNLLPTKNHRAFYRETESSWGGSVLFDAKRKEYHMFASDMSYNCTLQQWQTNSRVVHAVSQTPEGPYTQKDIAVDIWAHNPTIHLTPDGKNYVIYHIGYGRKHGNPVNCSKSDRKPIPIDTKEMDAQIKSDPNHPNMGVSSNADSNGLNNVFKEIDSDGGDYAYNNPGVYFFPNGSALLVYKIGCPTITQKFCREFAVAVAPSYAGPFKTIRNIAVYGEDPYVWRDGRGNFHMLFQGGNYDPSLPAYVGHFHTAFSADGFHWKVANLTEAYNQTYALTNGTSVKVYRRERCQLLFDESGSGKPKYLFNGVTERSDSQFSYTGVQPIQV